MKILSEILFLLFPSLKPNEREIEDMKRAAEFSKFMNENGYKMRVGKRGGCGWEKTKPESFYKDRPNPWFEFARIKGEYPYDKDGNYNP